MYVAGKRTKLTKMPSRNSSDKREAVVSRILVKGTVAGRWGVAEKTKALLSRHDWLGRPVMRVTERKEVSDRLLATLFGCCSAHVKPQSGVRGLVPHAWTHLLLPLPGLCIVCSGLPRPLPRAECGWHRLALLWMIICDGARGGALALGDTPRTCIGRAIQG